MLSNEIIKSDDIPVNTFRDSPELAAELDLTKNQNLLHYGKPIDVLDLGGGTNKKLWWICSECRHEWPARGDKRVNGQGCPACANQVINNYDGRNSMPNTHPELAIEYQGDATKVIATTHKILPWKCLTISDNPCGHEWPSVGHNRVQGRGCPACANQVINNHDGRNSMPNTHPELAIEYQGDATKIIAGTNKLLDWKCLTISDNPCGYEWPARGFDRIRGSGCPACASTGYDPSKIGYVYIHHYQDEINHWLKCGITNCPKDRFYNLSRNATKVNIEVQPLNIFKFDDGYLPIPCERELKDSKDIRFESGHDIDGKTEFFRYDALDQIKEVINRYCPK